MLEADRKRIEVAHSPPRKRRVAKGSQSHKWTGYGEISGKVWASYLWSARTRGIAFKVTLEQIWEKFEMQGRVCALSGLPLGFNPRTASLDRIDSCKEYTLDNIQWVHKDVNLMKNKFNQNYFVEVCRRIVDRYDFKEG